MHKQIIIPGVEVNHVFEMTGPSVHFKKVAKETSREIGMGNVNYEIEITSNYFSAFTPFSGLGNAWGTKFGFTFGCGPYSPDEVLFGNGLFAMAEFFRNIHWTPFENGGGYEQHSEAAKEFAKIIADTVYDIGLDCGRPIFPLVWTLQPAIREDYDYGAEVLTISITPRIAPSIIDHKRVGSEYYLTPRQVVSALVYFGTVTGREELYMGGLANSYSYLMSKIGAPSDVKMEVHMANAHGLFHDRWDGLEDIAKGGRDAFDAEPHIVEKIDELLQYRTNAAKAAWEIIMLMDRHFCNPAAPMEAVSE